jgi:hypothetical protein
MLVEALLFLVVAGGIVFLLLNTYLYKADYVSKAMDVSKENTCLKMNSDNGFGIWRSNTPCTLRFFVFLSAVGRGLDSEFDCSATPNMPGCAQTTVPTPCLNDCTLESMPLIQSHLKSIFRLSTGEVELFTSSPKSETSTGAYLKVITQRRDSDTTTKQYLEGVVLPAIPQQKWTMITIVKEGKRISIFYDSERVASRVLQFMPIDASVANEYICGSRTGEVIGNIGFLNWYSKAYTLQDVKEDFERLTNTRGVPRALDTIDLDPSKLFKNVGNVCAFGNCNPMPVVAPASPFVAWRV